MCAVAGRGPAAANRRPRSSVSPLVEVVSRPELKPRVAEAAPAPLPRLLLLPRPREAPPRFDPPLQWPSTRAEPFDSALAAPEVSDAVAVAAAAFCEADLRWRLRLEG